MAERPAEDKSGILPETSIFFYGIPAYGHLHSNLYLTGCLSAAGYRVVYYSMEPYRREIKANGCEFRLILWTGIPLMPLTGTSR